MSNTRSHRPFDTLEAAFRLGCAGPKPWSLDGRDIPGLPDRPIPLDELRAVLLHPSTSYRTRDAALGVLVSRARTEGGAATVGLAGVLAFGLRRAVSGLCDACPDWAADIEAEALAGLIEGITRTQPDRGRLAARLCWLARNRAKRLFLSELAGVGRPDEHPDDGCAPRQPWGHPEWVLAQAVDEGVLQRDDAALIAETRLGPMSFKAAADALGISYEAARWRRVRAERALAAWIASENYYRTFVTNPAPGPYLGCGGRPRDGREPDRRSKTCH